MTQPVDRPECVRCWLSDTEIQQFDDMKREGGFPSRAALARSIILAVLEDDARAHGAHHHDRSSDVAGDGSGRRERFGIVGGGRSSNP